MHDIINFLLLYFFIVIPKKFLIFFVVSLRVQLFDTITIVFNTILDFL